MLFVYCALCIIQKALLCSRHSKTRHLAGEMRNTGVRADLCNYKWSVIYLVHAQSSLDDDDSTHIRLEHFQTSLMVVRNRGSSGYDEHSDGVVSQTSAESVAQSRVIIDFPFNRQTDNGWRVNVSRSVYPETYETRNIFQFWFCGRGGMGWCSIFQTCTGWRFYIHIRKRYTTGPYSTSRRKVISWVISGRGLQESHLLGGALSISSIFLQQRRSPLHGRENRISLCTQSLSVSGSMRNGR